MRGQNYHLLDFSRHMHWLMDGLKLDVLRSHAQGLLLWESAESCYQFAGKSVFLAPAAARR